VPSTADLDAAARAAGNKPAEARTIGQALFAGTWPAQIIKVRVDGIGDHEVAGLVLSGVKFHGALDRAGFEREIEPVTGDYAQPVSRVVFAATCLRAELPGFGARLRAGEGVYWAPDFLRRL